MRNQRQIEIIHGALPRPRRRKTVVIADDGVNASVVLLDAADSVNAGSRFEHRGRQWVIRGPRPHSRVIVAEPLTTIRQ